MQEKISQALERYRARTGQQPADILGVLFDMDGILYDSMPGHASAWKQMCDENGIEATRDEFFGYEGRTGASTIEILMQRQYGRATTPDEVKRLYARKSELFKAAGAPAIMPGAQRAVRTVLAAGCLPVLVTGSGQQSIFERLEHDYPEAFTPDRRVTARDVVHGKPHPEPFLMGLGKIGATSARALAVDNAPLGVESASAAGIFTIGVRSGPLPEGSLLAAGADIELNSMDECADLLRQLL